MSSRSSDEKWFLGTDLKLDADGDLAVDETGDLDILDAEDCLEANLLDRLLTSPGGLILHPEFGGGLQEYVGGRTDPAALADLRAAVKHQVLKDPRVATVLSVEILTEAELAEALPDVSSTRRLYVRVSVETVSGQVVGNLVFPFETGEPREGA